MADVCTLLSIGITAMNCIGPLTCKQSVDNPEIVLCKTGPAKPCNSRVETYDCKRQDGSYYPKTITVSPNEQTESIEQ